MRTATLNPSLVIQTIRRILREHVTDSTMNRAVVSFIFNEGLVKKELWPAWHMRLTDAGAEYIRENSSDEGDED